MAHARIRRRARLRLKEEGRTSGREVSIGGNGRLPTCRRRRDEAIHDFHARMTERVRGRGLHDPDFGLEPREERRVIARRAPVMIQLQHVHVADKLRDRGFDVRRRAASAREITGDEEVEIAVLDEEADRSAVIHLIERIGAAEDADAPAAQEIAVDDEACRANAAAEIKDVPGAKRSANGANGAHILGEESAFARGRRITAIVGDRRGKSRRDFVQSADVIGIVMGGDHRIKVGEPEIAH